MIVLGVDVGKVTGLCLLDMSAPQPVYLDSCAVDEDLIGVLRVRFLERQPIVAIGVETPAEVFAYGRARGDMGARVGIERALLVARDAAGEARATARLCAAAASYHEAQAHEIRKAVLGRLPRAPRGKDTRAWLDGLVKRHVLAAVRLWPTRSNDHERDAAVAALWAGARHRLRASTAAARRV